MLEVNHISDFTGKSGGFDDKIRKELSLAEIETREFEEYIPNKDVPTKLFGRLQPFIFQRYSRHWIVKGNMPLGVALDIFHTANENLQIMAHGHPGNPKNHANWYDANQNRLLPKSEKHILDKLPDLCMRSEVFRHCRFVDNPSSEGIGFIQAYQIATQEGLNFFVEKLKEHKLV